MLISSGLVLLMVPAMCLFYSGASDRRTSLTLFRLPLITAALVGFQVCQIHTVMPAPSDYISGTSGDIAWRLLRLFPLLLLVFPGTVETRGAMHCMIVSRDRPVQTAQGSQNSSTSSMRGCSHLSRKRSSFSSKDHFKMC
jgi:hypothetical protein